MSVIDYTTYSAIRTTMGVDKFEITDEQLAEVFISAGLNRALSSVSGVFAPDTEERTLAGHHTYLKSLETLTVEQQELLETIEAYATYAVASIIVTTLPMAAPKTKGDGKSLATRFSSEATFRDVVASVKYGAMALKDSLKVSLGGRATEFTYMVAAKPTFDPYSS